MHFFTNNFSTINIPPLFTVTLFLIIGIIWYTSLTLFLTIFMLLLCYTLYTYIKQLPLPKQLILYSFFMCIGAWLHHKELHDYNDFYTFINNKKCTITGTVIDKADVLVQYKKSTLITLAIDTIAVEHCTKKSNKTLIFYTKSNNNANVGDTITLVDIQCKKPSSESFQRYQMKEQIVATIFDTTATYTINNHPTWSLRYWIWNQKKRLLDSLAGKLSENGFRFFSSLFLGNRACIKTSLEETNEQFKIWGISHFLARSGLHLALFILIWQAIFCIIPLPMIIKQAIISLLSCIYFILTWTSAPFTRSFALFILNRTCLLTKKSFHLLHYLTMVCLGFLLYCPLYLFFLDFQLSFSLTFALAWFSQLSARHEMK
ncbi:MAG TPA: ComEC/Rec2 family competence protein [Candidatus Babeliales bacterium]|jgi:predicted membrane metal-binding protein|nr:ComEC/Rec2 family competence protein [Candidatus Babeliales bacterium]